MPLKGVAKLKKLGVKKWVLVPHDVYLHKAWGVIRILYNMAGKVTFQVRGEEQPRCFLEKKFRKGLVTQVKEAKKQYFGDEQYEERPKILKLVCKDGTRIRIVKKQVVNLLEEAYEEFGS